MRTLAALTPASSASWPDDTVRCPSSASITSSRTYSGSRATVASGMRRVRSATKATVPSLVHKRTSAAEERTREPATISERATDWYGRGDMGAASAFSAAAVLVACAFAGATFERWLARRRRHDLAWATSMALFAAGALAYFFGVALGWRPWSFKAFYLLGGVLTVPVLALGTIYLLIGRRWGDRLALATALVGAFASG